MTPIASLADVEYCYLTTRGRTTGRPHRIEIWFVARDGGAYLFANSDRSDWYRNLEADPSVTLEIGQERRTTVARPVAADDPAVAVVRPAIVAKYQPTYGEDLGDWGATAHLVRVEWPD